MNINHAKPSTSKNGRNSVTSGLSRVTFRQCQTTDSMSDSDRETDSGHVCGSSGETDETASDCLSVSENRSEACYENGGGNATTNPAYQFDHLLKFNCQEFHVSAETETERHSNHLTPFSSLERSLLTSPIVSRKGSLRGVRGRVKAAIATYKENNNHQAKNFLLLERGKVTLYVTSLAVCRGPFLRCLEIRKILHNLMIKFTECDLYMSREYQQDLRDRVGAEKVDGVPHLFMEGHYIGDFETILNLNESGQLRTMLKPYKRYGVVPPCQQCGGFTVIPCSICCGSKKSSHRNSFTDQFYALRCSACDFNGLQHCPLCTSSANA